WLVIYDGCMWTFGMCLLYNSSYWSDSTFFWRDYPKTYLDATVKWYYLVQFAFWVQQFLLAVLGIEKRRKDFLEFMIHHVITCLLIGFSYSFNLTSVGHAVLCAMDFSDIVLAICKMLKYCQKDQVADVGFVFFVVTWIYTRHVWFGQIIWSTYREAPQFATMVWNPSKGLYFTPVVLKGFQVLLCGLYAVLLFWLVMIFKVVFKVLKGENSEDVRSEDEEEAGEEVEENKAPRLVFYIDGGAALEKKDTHQERQQKRDKAGKEAGAALDTLQRRIHNNKRLTCQHFLRAYKFINAAFYWATKDRHSFAAYLTVRNYRIVECDTEADTRIAADYRDMDVVMSRDSDYMGFRSVRTIWRPVGRWNIQTCLVYSKDDMLASLELTDVQLTALACVTKNDYESNIRGLALVSNFGTMKYLGSCDDVQTHICDYFQHPKVLKKNTDNQTFSNSIKVYVQCRQDRAPGTVPSSGPSYKDLRRRFQEYQRQIVDSPAQSSTAVQSLQDHRQASTKPFQRPRTSSTSVLCQRTS
ncbi:sphingosine N-acyltransferase lag1, partial [Linnemannia exigua]